MLPVKYVRVYAFEIEVSCFNLVSNEFEISPPRLLVPVSVASCGSIPLAGSGAWENAGKDWVLGKKDRVRDGLKPTYNTDGLADEAQPAAEAHIL